MTDTLALRENGKRVLVVDDDHDICAVIVESLRGVGVESVVAFDGLRALYEYQRAIDEYRHLDEAPEPFAAIVLDLALPEVSGFVVGQNIRNAEKHLDRERRTFIIACTAYDKMVDEELLKSIEPDAYIRKPWQNGELAETVLRVLGVTEEARELTLDEKVADIHRMVEGLGEGARVADIQRACVAEDLAASHQRADDAPPGEAGSAADAAARLSPKECEE